jgi:hypothetical protein
MFRHKSLIDEAVQSPSRFCCRSQCESCLAFGAIRSSSPTRRDELRPVDDSMIQSDEHEEARLVVVH